MKQATTQPASQTKTPENTPVPGGGRWRWDISLPGWVDVDTDPSEPTASATQPPATTATPAQPE